MISSLILNQYLERWVLGDPSTHDLASTILAIATAGIRLSQTVSRYGLEELEQSSDDEPVEEIQPLEVTAHNYFEHALRSAPVSHLITEESADILALDSESSLIVAIDSLDGLSNIDTNVSIGTIFSILEVGPNDIFNRPLAEIQKAAGFFLYGPQTSLVLTCGDGTEIFTLNPVTKLFNRVSRNHQIPLGIREFAINTSNYRYWDNPIRHFIDDCVAGDEGPLGVNFNMRWVASLVAEAFRILKRGGVFLYPADSREGYEQGRLNLLHEAMPLAMIFEQAGGMASNGVERILDLELSSLQQRVPLVFGSIDTVEEVIHYVNGESTDNTHFPLFENRSLLRS